MITYRAAYRPISPSARLGVARLDPGTPPPSPERVKTMMVLAGAGMLVVSGATVWVGLRAGLRDRGWASLAGWVAAAAAGVAGVMDVVATAGLLLMPNAEVQQAIQKVTPTATAPAPIPQ